MSGGGGGGGGQLVLPQRHESRAKISLAWPDSTRKEGSGPDPSFLVGSGHARLGEDGLEHVIYAYDIVKLKNLHSCRSSANSIMVNKREGPRIEGT